MGASCALTTCDKQKKANQTSSNIRLILPITAEKGAGDRCFTKKSLVPTKTLS